MGEPSAATAESLLDHQAHSGMRTINITFVTNLRAATLSISDGKDRGYELTHEYFVNARGKEYPIRGKGPPWENNSCALDCCLVAARLLRIGSTNIMNIPGSENTSFDSLGAFHKDFLKAVNHDWDTSPQNINLGKRDEILRSYVHAFNRSITNTNERTSFGSFHSAVNLWTFCTSMARQFNLKKRRMSHCTACRVTKPLTSYTQHTVVDVEGTPDDAEQGLPMEHLLRRLFGPVKSRNPQQRHDCGASHSLRRCNEIQGSLPSILVITPQRNYQNIKRATSDRITFTYLSSTKGKQRVTYRWIGGIYVSKHHYRLFWTDTAYQDPSGHIKVYDGMAAGGTIIGGIPPDHPHDKVPDYWANGTSLLFYELVSQGSPKRAGEDAPKVATDVARTSLVQRSGDTHKLLKTPSRGTNHKLVDRSSSSGLKYSTGTKREAPSEESYPDPPNKRQRRE